MLLLGFGAALRRSELVGLSLGDVETVAGRGLLVTVARSKTDQHGAGQRVAIWAEVAKVPPASAGGMPPEGNPAEPGFCPAAALEARLAHRSTPTSTGPPPPPRGPNDLCSAPSPRLGGSPATACPTRRWYG
jgi:hypothetical protein